MEENLSLRDLRERANALYQDADLDREDSQRYSERISDADRKLHRIQSKDAFLRFLSDYISQEHQKWSKRYDTDGTRDEPLCDCGGAPCTLQRGKVPSKVRKIQSEYLYSKKPEKALTEYIVRHGDERILTEAQDAWAEQRASVRDEYRQIIRELRAETSNELSIDI